MEPVLHNRVVKYTVLIFTLGYVFAGLVEVVCCKRLITLTPIMFILTMFLIPYLGCYGAIKENKFALVLFVVVETISSVILTINLVDEIGIWSLNFGDPDVCESHLASYFHDPDSQTQHIFERVEIECCGIKGPRDYMHSDLLPPSCCRKRKVVCKADDDDVIETGCAIICEVVNNAQQEIKFVLVINALIGLTAAGFALRLASIIPRNVERTFV